MAASQAHALKPPFGARHRKALLVAEHAGDTYAIPVALGISWVATPKFSLDLAFGLAAVKSANSMAKAFDSRNLTLGVGYAM